MAYLDPYTFMNRSSDSSEVFRAIRDHVQDSESRDWQVVSNGMAAFVVQWLREQFPDRTFEAVYE